MSTASVESGRKTKMFFPVKCDDQIPKSSHLPQRRGEGLVHPQDHSPPSVSRSGGVGGRQPALSAEERHHQEDVQWRDGGRTQALAVYCSETTGCKCTTAGIFKWEIFPEASVDLVSLSLSLLLTVTPL